MIDTARFIADCAAIREQAPLIHCITNYVAMEFNADALLAIGASPLMSFCPEEADELEQAAAALVINIGCLDLQQIEGMKAAAAAAVKYGKPWVLDPVGAGASTIRTQTCLYLIDAYHPTIIRGNASEIMALAMAEAHRASDSPHWEYGSAKAAAGAFSTGEGLAAAKATAGAIAPKGVDSRDSSEAAIEYAKKLAKATGAVVSVSGETDYITDGKDIETITGGSPLQTKVTAMGCTATAITAAFAAVNPDPLQAAAEAMTVMAICGENAAFRCKGTGTLRTRFIDELNHFDEQFVKF